MAARYPSTSGAFSVTFVSEPPSERMEMNTSTLPREMAPFTACFTASSAKERALGSLTVQSK